MYRTLLIFLCLMTVTTACAQNGEMKPASDAVSLFDGQTLSGWKLTDFNKPWWEVKDGVISGGSLEKRVPKNYWLISEKSYENFEMTLKIRFINGEGPGLKNSGIQVRSTPKGNSIAGYQIDAGPSPSHRKVNKGLGYWGNIWDEHRRGQIVTASNQDLLLKSVKQWDEWNSYKIVCNGKNIKTWINGILAHDYTEKDDKIAADGIIALQAHSGGKFLVQFKDITIKELAPTEGSTKWSDPDVSMGKKKKKKKKK